MFNFFKKKNPEKKINLDEKIVENYENIGLIAEYFYSETGITFDKQMSILKNKVILFCKQKRIASCEQLLLDIKSDLNIKQEIIDLLTTNETYFYREFSQIEEVVLLAKHKNTDIRILCAPSATGEEPYSIAIALLESGVSSKQIKIVGIDINHEALTKAKMAIYGERNVRNLSLNIRNKYFIEKEKKYILNTNVKNLVTFELVNIFDKSFTEFGKFDFIFSRNMLIYFDKITKQKARDILEKMRKDENQDIFFGHADLF